MKNSKQTHPQRAKIERTIFETYRSIGAAVKYLQRVLKGRKHDSMVILGSGLGETLPDLDEKITVPYENIPYWPISTAPGHAGQLVSGRIGKRWVLVMKGRPHSYEGWEMNDIAFPIRVAYVIGVRNLVITNACGGLRRDLQEADLMLIEDHINLMGKNPLIGPNLDKFGVRFPQMHEPYSKKLLATMLQVAKDTGVPVKKGVHCSITGPTFETPAEMRMMKILGADTAGMSTILEDITAKHCTKRGAMKVLGISIVTDLLRPDHPAILTEDDVIRIAKKASPKLRILLKEFLKRI